MTEQKMPMFESDGNFAIHVEDLQKAKHFYGDVLGFELVHEGEGTIAFETGQFMLFINKDTETRPFIPAIEVPDIKAAKAHIEANGCKILKEWPEYNSLYFQDPFGMTIDLIQKRSE